MKPESIPQLPKTTAPVRLDAKAQILPEFGSISDACRLSGLGRTRLYAYIQRGAIRSCHLRDHGRVKGRRLVDLMSLRQFLHSQMTGG